MMLNTFTYSTTIGMKRDHMTNGWHDKYEARLRRVEMLLYILIGLNTGAAGINIMELIC